VAERVVTRDFSPPDHAVLGAYLFVYILRKAFAPPRLQHQLLCRGWPYLPSVAVESGQGHLLSSRRLELASSMFVVLVNRDTTSSPVSLVTFH
jgi:hypothetical protein